VKKIRTFFAINLLWLLSKRHRTVCLATDGLEPSDHRFQLEPVETPPYANFILQELVPEFFVSVPTIFSNPD
jgi:hypothetical protein